MLSILRFITIPGGYFLLIITPTVLLGLQITATIIILSHMLHTIRPIQMQIELSFICIFIDTNIISLFTILLLTPLQTTIIID